MSYPHQYYQPQQHTQQQPGVYGIPGPNGYPMVPHYPIHHNPHQPQPQMQPMPMPSHVHPHQPLPHSQPMQSAPQHAHQTQPQPTKPPMINQTNAPVQNQTQTQNAAPNQTPASAPQAAAAPAPASSAKAAPYIGGLISLISKSNLRYEGTLHAINSKESTVALKDVRNFGSENRQSDTFIAADPTVFELMVFHGKDIRDLHVVERKAAAAPADPAILSAKVAAPTENKVDQSQSHSQAPQNSAPVHRVQIRSGPMRDDTAEFDFASSNAKFTKVKKPDSHEEIESRDHQTPAYELPDEDNQDSEQPQIAVKYDKKKSFFDDLETGNSRQPPRHVQRRQDQDTFGEIANQHNNSSNRGGNRGQRGGNRGGNNNRGYQQNDQYGGGNRYQNQNQYGNQQHGQGQGYGGNRGGRRGGGGQQGNGNWSNQRNYGGQNGGSGGGYRRGGNSHSQWRQGGDEEN